MISCSQLMRVLALLLVLVFAYTHRVQSADVCDLSSCRCYSKPGGTLVVCRPSNALTDVPTWPPDSRHFWNISLAGNQITDLKADAFSGLHTHTLDLSGNALLSISAYAFRSLEVRRLIIESRTIDLLPTQAFTHIPGLRHLVMRKFALGTLTSRSFAMLTELRSLQLEGCNLQHLGTGALGGLTHLETLVLDSNLLQEVPRLGDVQSLRRLDLSSNNIARIERDQFAALLQIDVLDLSRNSLSSLASDSFAGAISASLTTLYLDNNALSSDSLDIISSLRNLTKLSMNYNKITSIHKVLFAHLSKLQVLELRSNELSVLDEATFEYAVNLEHLDLANNFLTSLPSRIFHPLAHLSTLILDDQHGANLSSSAHALMFKTQRQTLRHLSLVRLLLNDEIWQSLEQLSQLHYVSLNDNKLRSIGSLAGCTNLIHLHLDNNLLERLDRQDLGASSLRTLSLANNSVYNLGHCFLNQLPELELINLNQNRLRCDCHLVGLHRWMSRDPLPLFPNQWRCSSPAALSGELLARLNESQLICTDGTSVQPCLTTISSTTSTTTSTTTSSTSSAATTSVTSTTVRTSRTETTTTTSTTTTSTTTAHVQININILHRSTDAISLSWSHVNDDVDFRGYKVVIKHENLTVRVSELLLEPRFTIKSLQSDTEYGLCVLLEFSRRTYRASQNCITASTQQRHEADTVSAGVAAGVAVTLCVLIVAVFVVCLYLQRRRKPVPVISHCTRWYKKQRSPESQQRQSQLQQFSDKHMETNSAAGRYADKHPAPPTMPLPPTPDERGYNSSGATCITKDSAYGSVYWEIDNADEPRTRIPLTLPHHVHADSSATQVYPASSISDEHSTDVRLHSEPSSPGPAPPGNILTFGGCKLYSDTGILV